MATPSAARRSTRQDSAAAATAWRRTIRRRTTVACICLGIWVVAIQARLVQLQAVRHEEYAARAVAQQQSTMTLNPKRGDITDRRGTLLAYSVDTKAVNADPSLIEDPAAAVEDLCAVLGDCTADERASMVESFGRDVKWVRVRPASDVTPQQVARLKTLDHRWLILQTETRRAYPQGELAAHVLGFVGTDANGLAGIEHLYDEQIRGQAGLLRYRRDARDQRLMPEIEREPTSGETVELTIDHILQYVTERELAAGVAAQDAVSAMAIVMDPNTGELLALANVPTFDPNRYRDFLPDARRNRAVQDVYEPGSTFKIVTASAALEEGMYDPGTMIDVSSGVLRVPGRGRPIIDDHPAGRPLSLEDVIVKSSNVGAVRVGLDLGAERISRYARRFGIGQKPTDEFAGQSAGFIRPPEAMTNVSLSSVSMGYEVNVTGLQMATAVSAIANGGLLMEPHIVKARIRDGVREEIGPRELRRAVSPEVAAIVATFMENVVKRGTATAAAVDGYQVAGKTGTTKKAVPGGYSPTARVSSFVGFVPAHDPVFTILVVIDTPRKGVVYGGAVAAPVFQRIADAALRLYRVTPTENPEPPFVRPRRNADAVRPAVATARRLAVATTPVADVPADLVPDVSGLNAREAMAVLQRAGFSVTTTGNGVVVRQVPAAGAPRPADAEAAIELARVPLDTSRGGGGR